MPQHDTVRETAIGYFALLRDFAKLRSRPVQDVNRYESHLWLTDVPIAPDCFVYCRDGDEHDSTDDWLRIDKRAETDCPTPDASLRPWLQTPLVHDDDVPPVLRQVLYTRLFE